MVTVRLIHCGRVFQTALLLPWGRCGLLVPEVFEFTTTYSLEILKLCLSLMKYVSLWKTS